MNRVALFPSTNRVAQVAGVALSIRGDRRSADRARRLRPSQVSTEPTAPFPLNQSGSAIVQGSRRETSTARATSGGPLDAGVGLRY